MNPKLLAVLAMSAALAGILWFVARGAGGGHDGARQAARGPLDGDAGATEVPSGAGTGDELTRSARPGARRESAAEPHETAGVAPPERGTWASFPTEDAGWVEVRLALPSARPADDAADLFVFASASGTELGEWQRNALASAATPSRWHDVLDEETACSREPVSASGTYRLPVPAAAPNCVVLLLSRYVYAEPLLVPLEADGARTAIEGELGAWVTGRCTFGGPPDRRPAPDHVALELQARTDASIFGDGGDNRTVAVTDDFTFELRAISARHEHMVSGRVDGYVPYLDLAFAAGPGEHVELVVPFRAGGTVTGRVVGDSGEAVPDATVMSESTRGFFTGPATAATEADGSYELRALAPGEVALHVTAEGWLDAHGEPFVIADEETLAGVDFVLSAGNRIAGRVVEVDGAPAPEAWVAIAGRGEQAQVQADADGRFTRAGLGEGTFDVTAWTEAARVLAGTDPEPTEEGHKRVAKATGVAAGTTGLVLTLAEPIPLRGRVVDDLDAPVEAFDLAASPQSEDAWSSTSAVSLSVAAGEESAPGTFTLHVPFAGAWNVTASAAGHVEAEALAVDVPTSGPVELVLQRSPRISGTVLDPAGRPIEGARVSLTDPASGPTGVWSANSVETDAEGAFLFEEVDTIRASLRAEHDDWAASEEQVVELAAGAETSDLVLTLRVGGRITGAVYDAEGNPRVGQSVAASRMGLMGGDENATTTDEAGAFVIEHVDPGSVTVFAMPSQDEIIETMLAGGQDEAAMVNFMGQMLMETVEVRDGEEVHVVLGARPRAPVQVSGTVTEAREPLSGATVFAVAEGGSFLEGMKAAQTDRDGRYALTLDRPGDYQFGVGLGGFGSPTVTFYVDVPEVSSLDYDLALPLGRIEGRVLGPDGEPVAGVGVRAAPTGGVIALQDLGAADSPEATAGDGSFVLDHLTEGTYAVYVGATPVFGGGSSGLGAAVVGGVRVAADRATSGLEVRLARAGRIEGTLQDGAGTPVAGASVYVRDEAGRVLSSVSPCTSDASGRFSYVDLPPGALTVSARTDALASADSDPVVVRSGETTRVALVLEPAAWLVVTLLEDGDPVRARLRVLDEAGRQVNGLASAEALMLLVSQGFSSKERRVGPLAPGKYTLVAAGTDGKEAEKTVRIRPGQEERKVKLRLK